MNNPHEPATLRFATPDDLSAVFALIQELAEYERLVHTFVATEDGLRDVLFGERPAAEVILAFVDGHPVGFALFYQNLSTFRGCRGMYLEDLYVRPEHRGRGIGKQLLRKLAAVAHERAWGMLEWRVLDWNTPAINFYRSLGAVPLDDWTVLRVTDDAFDRLRDLQ